MGSLLVWWVTSKGSPFQFYPGEWRHTVMWPDRLLRPIRPDGLTDKEVRDLYAPAPAEVATSRKPVHGGLPNTERAPA